MSIVSVVVLNLNKSQLTLQCLDSIAQTIGAIEHKIIVVDNGSAADELEILGHHLSPNVNLIRLARNVGFGKGCNVGAEQATGRFLLFVNNDVIIGPGVIDGLLKKFDSLFSPGAIAPRFVYPDGTIQEVGAFLMRDGWSFQLGKQAAKLSAYFQTGTHIVEYCSAACLLVERHVFLACGGFDPEFDPAYFEDADLCLRLKAKGLYTYCAADLTAVHQENATSSMIWSRKEIISISETNHRKFVRRWSSYLENRLQDIPRIADDSSHVPQSLPAEKILLACDGALQGSVSGTVTLRCAAALQAQFAVTIASNDIDGYSGFAALREEFGIDMRRIRWIAFDTVDRSSYDHAIPISSDAMEHLISLDNIKGIKILFDRIGEPGKFAPAFEPTILSSHTLSLP